MHGCKLSFSMIFEDKIQSVAFYFFLIFKNKCLVCCRKTQLTIFSAIIKKPKITKLQLDISHFRIYSICFASVNTVCLFF